MLPLRSDPSRWHDILLEVRALLHEPLRYHPNIVRLLDVGWSSSSENGSPFPAFILEFADFGTFDSLQRGQDMPLPFRVKQKLCYDVGRGLSVLHACGIVHGDLKHENVLIFANRHKHPPGQPFTAKLADFGGAVMDVGTREGHLLRMATIPYEAPELGQQLTVEGIKATDTYSFGMLVWRAMLDCQDVLVASRFRDARRSMTPDDLSRLKTLKRSDEFQKLALDSLKAYFRALKYPSESLEMVTYVVRTTIVVDSTSRSLVKAQARLRGIPPRKVPNYLAALHIENEERLRLQRAETPGRHGITLDSLGYALGRYGDDFDIQDNLPGTRPDVPEPSRGAFLFEPFRLKRFLNWSQQVAMFKELERLSDSPPFDEDSAEIQPWVASYHLFQACLSGFGTAINPQRACYWLWKASLPAFDAADTDYLAKAWLTRICHAVGSACPLTPDEQLDDMFISIVRGHRDCEQDSEIVISRIGDAEKEKAAREKIQQAVWIHRVTTGGTGMPHYIERNMPREYNLYNLEALEADIRAELGEEYESCLRDASESPATEPPKNGYRFDKVYVNQRGHGLLHYAATWGTLAALKLLVEKYRCDINLPNQSLSETPLVCACRAGQFECAMFLLDSGAHPNASPHGEEGPLDWISRFDEDQMRAVTQRLVDGGADVSKSCGGMRKDVRRIFADWEDRLRLPLKPLGRAVLMKSLAAVRCLLQIASADPSERHVLKDKKVSVLDLSAIELAAVLTLPDILQELLDHQDAKDGGCKLKAFDEWEMLERAHEMASEGAPDPLTMHSRLVRHGAEYKDCLLRTFQILHNRRMKQESDSETPSQPTYRTATSLCREVELGQLDIVQSLLDLGHDVNGVPNARPIATAVTSNHIDMFELLLAQGADLVLSAEEPTLLQAFASRPKTSPGELKIAQFLVENGVVVEDAQADQPSPLASAIRNGYFDLADLLMAHGAGESLNDLYQWQPHGPFLSVLGMLLKTHSYSSLQGITYLVKAHEVGTVTLQPLADATRNLSAVHLLALQEPGRMNPRQQVSSRIIQKILSVFPSPKSLGDCLLSDEVGTPASAAILSCNAEVVSALLEGDYQKTFLGRVRVAERYGVTDLKDGIFPSWLVLTQLQWLVGQFQVEIPHGRETAEKIESLDRIRRELFAALPLINEASPQLMGDDAPFTEEHVLLAAKTGYDMLWKNWRELHASTLPGNAMAMSSSNAAPEDNMPIDLAQMTEDKRNNWWDKGDDQ